MRGQFVDLSLQLHQSLTHIFDLLFSERAALHPAYCLALQKLAQQFNQTKHEFRQSLLNVLWRTVDSGFVSAGSGMSAKARINLDRGIRSPATGHSLAPSIPRGLKWIAFSP